MSMIGGADKISRNRQLLIGSYFTMEYSIESAALFNPSIVRHQNQRNLPEGAVRFIMSLRATGEGHVSSIVFRTGVIYSGRQIQMDPPSRFANPIRVFPTSNTTNGFSAASCWTSASTEAAMDPVLHRLGDSFTMTQLEQAITAAREAAPENAPVWRNRSKTSAGWPIPITSWSSRARRRPRKSSSFRKPATKATASRTCGWSASSTTTARSTYYGTYTAFDGFRTLPHLIETRRFSQDRRPHAQRGQRRTKGMALFPRRIGGHYVMCSRIDGENLYLMYSDIVHFWETAELLQTPEQPWEFVQIGNCGSPLETPEGWLLLTHGVGPMRTYCIGAMLLDLHRSAAR